MATDYALNLRATLDTTQVKQQLQQLRAAQTQASQPNAGGLAGGSNMGLSHLQKIEVQLTKLNSTITGLQRAIEQLNRLNTQKVNSPSSSNALNRNSNIPIAPNSGGYMPQITRKWRDAYNNVITRSPDLKKKAFERYGTTDENILAELYASKYDSEKYKQFKRENDLVSSRMQQLKQMRQNRQLASMIGGQLLGGAADIANNLGYSHTGSILESAGTGLTAGAGAGLAASMIGGVVSKFSGLIAVVVGVGSSLSKLYSSATSASDAVDKMSKQLNETFQTLHQSTINANRSIQETQHQVNANRLEYREENGEIKQYGNVDEARRLAKLWKENADSLRNQLIESNPLSEEQRIKERGESRKQDVEKAIRENNWSILDSSIVSFLNHLGGSLDLNETIKQAKNEVDTQTAEQITKMQRQYASLQQDLASAEKIQSTYQGVVDKFDSRKKNETAKDAAEVAARLRMTEANDATIFGYSTRSQLNQTQDFVNSILGIKSIGALDKFNAISAELGTARSQKNTALTNAFEIARYLKQNEGKIDSKDMQAKQKQQAQYDKEVAAIDQRIGILESALADIQTNTIAPDLSHVTSLAQYGFNMGEKDNGIERMEKYYTKSINLQKQIKDKLQEGVKMEAVYN